MNKYNWQEGEPKNVNYNCWNIFARSVYFGQYNKQESPPPPFHPLIKVGALSCNHQETEPALPTGRSGNGRRSAGGGGVRNLDIFLSRTVYYEVSHKRQKCCWKKLATFSEFSKLPFQNKCKYKYSTLPRIFLMPRRIHLNMKGFEFSLIWKGI